ncbi:hypothetical protein CALCODRAFT_502948 [Calocera cornea HHB12733]|uniref:Uncharacterized protein n=1 Tax=Calocera cornea HHB12733 TaxID=1353952 RepID=A0A165D2A7_9BASI|nr:hypothetical protein CALCODRAFT_502948 [Calocera cornea HHB12733]
MASPLERIRCPAFVSTNGPHAVVHYGPCPFIHPFEAGWSRAPSPDASTIEAFRQEMPIRGPSRSAAQQLNDEIFGTEDEENATSQIPEWKDLDQETVFANLQALNAALASLEYPTLEIATDSMDTGEGPSVSFSATGGYTYPQEVQYSRAFSSIQTFDQSWAEMEKNSQKQWDVAHGQIRNLPVGRMAGHVVTRPTVITTGAAGPSGPSSHSPITPRSPDWAKRKREGGLSIKAEPSLSSLAPSAKRSRRDDSPDGPSLGEQLRVWRNVLQPMLRPETRADASWDKMREVHKIIERLEEAKDNIPRDLLGKIADRGGTKLGIVIGKLAQVEDMPYEDMFHVRQRASGLARYWGAKFGKEEGDGG